MSATVSPSAGRRTFQATEPIHAMIYFTPHFLPAYEAAGLRGRRMGYFASRAAAMGPVPADVVIATFFNFNPALVRRAIPDAWALASPEAILAARLDAVDASLRQAWGDEVGSAAVAEAAELARVAALAATQRPQGRPLFAAHAALSWPDEPHLVLWHAQTLLREYRGDGHVALLAAAGLSPVEALVTHAASGAVAPDVLRDSRAWSEQDWAEGVASVRARGWLANGAEADGAGRVGGPGRVGDAGRVSRAGRVSDAGRVSRAEPAGAEQADGEPGNGDLANGDLAKGQRAKGQRAKGQRANDELALSAAGQAFRQGLEDQTDELAVAAYAALGEAGCARLLELALPLSQAVIDSGLYRNITLPRSSSAPR
jgi:hypothetical protein